MSAECATDARAALTRLLTRYTAEVTTRDRSSLDAAGDLLAPGAEVFIAALFRDSPEQHVAAAVQLRRAGLKPVPHIVARNLTGHAALDALLARLAGEAGVTKALVLGGDRDRPAGPLHSSLQLIETGLFEKHGVREVLFGCYPEGHPRIHESALESALSAKLAAAARAGLGAGLVSQFCFDASPIIAMARRLREAGVAAPIRVGVAGPMERAALLKYAVICGVGPSLRALKERPDLERGAVAGVTPEAVLREVARAQAQTPSLGVIGAHFFTFGALASTVKWVRGLL
ncbi:MAG: methylenetetrahydrofolate reductase [Hydrogenophilaceae bacterium]|jgi:methylenetetrahydrofolate reductase (NADPH)|nr:methylenetetrahydrofolate reductase [Hydrogenophilaceae bacterium]